MRGSLELASAGGEFNNLSAASMPCKHNTTRFSQRYERGSTMVTSNLLFEDWTSVLGSERPTVRCLTG